MTNPALSPQEEDMDKLCERIKGLAKKATPGKRTVYRARTPSDGGYDEAVVVELDGENRCIAECIEVVGHGVRVNATANADLFAALDPTTILAILADREVRKAEGAVLKLAIERIYEAFNRGHIENTLLNLRVLTAEHIDSAAKAFLNRSKAMERVVDAAEALRFDFYDVIGETGMRASVSYDAFMELCKALAAYDKVSHG